MVAPNHTPNHSSIEVFSNNENNYIENQSFDSLNININIEQQFGNEEEDRVLTTTDMFELHKYVKEWCRVSEDDSQLWIGKNEKRLSFGPIDEWTQRRSVSEDMKLLRNGLKPIKGFANKFTVNQINENNDSINESECEIEFTNRNDFCGQFPISEDCKIIATTRGSQLFVLTLPYNENNEVIGIRPNDGFVLIHSNLSVFNSPKIISIETNCDNNTNQLQPFYKKSENGHLFILGEGGHLLLIDKRFNRHQYECVLLVGIGGLHLFSLFHLRSFWPQINNNSSDGQREGYKSSKDGKNGTNRSIASSSSGSPNTVRQLNSFEQKTNLREITENRTKRQLSSFEGQTKKHKCNYPSLNGNTF